ncbi:unnamed protein product, partial [Arctogadus glacialis]
FFGAPMGDQHTTPLNRPLRRTASLFSGRTTNAGRWNPRHLLCTTVFSTDTCYIYNIGISPVGHRLNHYGVTSR